MNPTLPRPTVAGVDIIGRFHAHVMRRLIEGEPTTHKFSVRSVLKKIPRAVVLAGR